MIKIFGILCGHQIQIYIMIDFKLSIVADIHTEKKIKYRKNKKLML